MYLLVPFQWRDVKSTTRQCALREQFLATDAATQTELFGQVQRVSQGRQLLRLRRVSFDNGVQFGSLFSEPIITEILRDLGVPTYRLNYARLFVNDQYQGVYVNVERIDESFMERNLPDPDGALFKADVGGPGGNLEFVGDDPAAYERALESKSASAEAGARAACRFHPAG